MIRHIVMLKFKPEASRSAIDACKAEVSHIPERIPGIRSFFCGSNVGAGSEGLGASYGGNFDFVVMSDLDDYEAYRRYADHPAHAALNRDFVRPVISDRVAIQSPLHAEGIPN